MKHLIIPDIHERLGRLRALDEHIEKADKVIFLGDWWDTFRPQWPIQEILAYIPEKIYDPKFTFLWGNHDCHYAFDKADFICSGYDHHTKAFLRKNMPTEAWRRFKVFETVDKYVVSHAGFHPKTLKYKDQTEEALEEAFAGRFHPLWQAGKAVGGYADFGGPTWLRWWEMEDLDFYQIVGHTPGKEVRQDGKNTCLDTSLNDIAWIDDETGELTIERVVV